MSSSPRTDLEILMNEPVRIRLSEDWTVEVREPTNAELGEYMVLMNSVVLRFFRENLPLLTAALKNDDVSEIPLDLGALSEALELLVARIVDRDVDVVRNEMTARQSAAVIKAFLDVLGWEFIKETFLQAMRAYQATAAKTGNAAAPAWPSASSPKSPGTTG